MNRHGFQSAASCVIGDGCPRLRERSPPRFVRKGRPGIDVSLLSGAHITKGRACLKVQEGTWTCPRPDAPEWHAIGPQHEIRLSLTAEVLVDEPFYDTSVNKRIDVRTFVDEADAAATASRTYFAHRIDGAGTITKLDQRRKA